MTKNKNKEERVIPRNSIDAGDALKLEQIVNKISSDSELNPHDQTMIAELVQNFQNTGVISRDNNIDRGALEELDFLVADAAWRAREEHAKTQHYDANSEDLLKNSGVKLSKHMENPNSFYWPEDNKPENELEANIEETKQLDKQEDANHAQENEETVSNKEKPNNNTPKLFSDDEIDLMIAALEKLKNNK